jgi:H+/Cl- antiporter ClcA
MIVEVAPLKVAQFTKTLIACLVSSTIAFAIYYAIAGDTFLGVFAVPAYSYKDWHLLAAIPLGLAAGVLALIVVIVVGVMKKLCAALVVKQPILIAAVGGLIFGLVGVALPLTMTTGTGNLPVVIHDGTALGAGLLIAVVFGKLLAFGVCEGTGFLGGPVLVSLFIGGTAGSAIHALIPGVPEGLAFTAMFAALPGALLAAPFSLILLAAITTNTSGLHIAPVAIAVITAYLAVSGTGTLRALAERGRKSGHGSPQPGESNGPGSHPAPAG